MVVSWDNTNGLRGVEPQPRYWLPLHHCDVWGCVGLRWMLPFHCKRIKSDWSKKLKIGFLPEIFISYSISPQKSKGWVKLGFHLSPDKHSEATAKEGVFSVICKSRTVFCKLLGLADTSGDQSFSPSDGKLMFNPTRLLLKITLLPVLKFGWSSCCCSAAWLCLQRRISHWDKDCWTTSMERDRLWRSCAGL